MLTIEWLAEGKIVATDRTPSDDLTIAQGKALGRAIFLARKHERTPTSYRILDAEGHQIHASELPAELLPPHWVTET